MPIVLPMYSWIVEDRPVVLVGHASGGLITINDWLAAAPFHPDL
jgi:alpha-beta hydrolase superfamily lysophospholipase